MDRVRVGYVGCGGMAQRIHLPNFATIADCDLIALAALRRALGEKVQRRFDIPRLYRDHRELIADPDVDGKRAVLETGWLRHHRWDEHIQIYFERGWVKVTAAPNMQLNGPPSDVEVYRIDQRGETGYQRTVLQPIPEPNWTWHFRREAVHFVECLKTGAPFRTSGEDALTDVRLMEEIYRTWLQV